MDTSITASFLPWWPTNPYQVLLKQEINKQGVRVVGNPPLSLLRVLAGVDGLDVLHIHWPHGTYKTWFQLGHVLIVLCAYRIVKNNIVWTVHELDAYESSRPQVDAWFRRVLMSLCRCLIVHGDYTRELIRSEYAFDRQIAVVRHPAYTGAYPNTIDRASSRDHLAITPGSRVFLYFGYIKPYKGVEDLIRAFASVEDENAVLLLVGKPLDDNIRQQIEALAAPDQRIRTVLGYVPDEHVQYYFNAADIVVFPFRHTQTSGSLMLALTFGRPVIAPRIATLPEYIDATSGILFDPEKPDDLARALNDAETAPLERMADAAREQGQRHTWAEMAARHADLYREIARKA